MFADSEGDPRALDSHPPHCRWVLSHSIALGCQSRDHSEHCGDDLFRQPGGELIELVARVGIHSQRLRLYP